MARRKRTLVEIIDQHERDISRLRSTLARSGGGGGGGGVTDHGALTGLGDDDHAQYWNDARGDAKISTHEANSGAHHTKYTDLEAAAKIAADALYLPNTGGTLTGLLTLSGSPASDLHAATKKYVDDTVIVPSSALDYTSAIASGTPTKMTSASNALTAGGSAAALNSASPGDFLTIELDTAQTADGLTMDQHATSYCGDYTVQASLDGLFWTDIGVAAGETADHSITFTPSEGKFFRILMDATNGNWHTYFAEFTTTGASAVITATAIYEEVSTGGATATASEDNGNGPERAIDANQTTYWGVSGLNGTEWWKIDFGSAVELGGLEFRQHAAGNTNDFSIDYSDNDVDWIEAGSWTGIDYRTEKFFDPQTARYWRFNVNGTPGANGFIYDMRFFSAELNYVAYLPLTGGEVTGAVTLSGGITQEAWTAPTLLNSWVDYGSGFQDARYRKDASGVVHIQGLVKSGTITSGTTLFTLPVGYRPAATLIIPSISFAGLSRFDILSSGVVQIRTDWHNAWSSINCSFAT